MTSESLHFALPSALHLAEAGSKVHEKYIGASNLSYDYFYFSSIDCATTGYSFLSEVMPPDHELALMLVNTIRKVS